MARTKKNKTVTPEDLKTGVDPSALSGRLSHSQFLSILVMLGLVLVTFFTFWQVQNNGFISYDDPDYVTENFHVQSGLTLRSIGRAFTTTHSANWHPLTWLSHIIDYEIYGLDPRGYHMTNLLFHIANTVLLFLVLQRMTGAIWKSGFVAALFALHPLHVESVAWVAERKDVLSTFFWMLTMGVYVLYTEHRSFPRYLWLIVLFVLGLLSKPMLVTLPFVLLLLDYWPLGRLQSDSPSPPFKSAPISFPFGSLRPSPPFKKVGQGGFLLEKVPLFALSAVSCVVTFVAQRSGEAVSTLRDLPLGTRFANALVSYTAYIGKMLWPQDLGVLYPHPLVLPLWKVAGAALALGSISFLVLHFGRNRGYLPVGWLWYLGTLIPVIGIVQVGAQAMADRYTYIPLIGLFIMIAFEVPDLFSQGRYTKIALNFSAVLILAVLIFLTKAQVLFWQNDISLFKHTLRVTRENSIIHGNLGGLLQEQGKLGEAKFHFDEALRIDPENAGVHANLGLMMNRLGKYQEAIMHFRESIRLNPRNPETHNNLGIALAEEQRTLEAVEHFREALRINPDFVKAHFNLGKALADKREYQDAIHHFAEAIRLKPDFAKAHYSLGLTYLDMGKRNLAQTEVELLKTMNPDLANKLAQRMSS